MAKDGVDAGETVLRPLDLDPERAGRAERAPYAIVDIGSNSVRLVVYDQLVDLRGASFFRSFEAVNGLDRRRRRAIARH